MIEFEDSNAKELGRADIVDIVILEGDRISKASGRPGFKPYFLIKITFSSNSEWFIDVVPTGILKTPLVETPEECIITDGDNEWYGCRHLTLDQLIELEQVMEESLFILESYELPERLKHLTSADREHILGKIMKFCDTLHEDLR